jgi:hypothetical protein
MSRADYAIDNAREALVVHLIRDRWPTIRRVHPVQRLHYAVACMVCDEPSGLVERGRLIAALADREVTARALGIIAIVRLEQDDGGAWPDG